VTVRPGQLSAQVIWHDLECGAYAADLPVWRSLAEEYRGPLLDVGAGTGRVTLDLARRGHRVTALDSDPALIAELARRADGLPITTLHCDARELDSDERFGLIIVPMQTVQLLGGERGRRRFLETAVRHLHAGGVLAVAITEVLEPFSLGDGYARPLPDIRELGGIVYSSQPTAVREDRDGFILERLRETIRPDGAREVEHDLIRLDRVVASQLEREARTVGLRAGGRESVAATDDHVGSVVVILRG
jgi:SAM-dependent methyltransferase